MDYSKWDKIGASEDDDTDARKDAEEAAMLVGGAALEGGNLEGMVDAIKRVRGDVLLLFWWW
jgi:hypothetical protein